MNKEVSLKPKGQLIMLHSAEREIFWPFYRRSVLLPTIFKLDQVKLEKYVTGASPDTSRIAR